jgi:hypothetical protein
MHHSSNWRSFAQEIDATLQSSAAAFSFTPNKSHFARAALVPVIILQNLHAAVNAQHATASRN